jgi:hypothetical protein
MNAPLFRSRRFSDFALIEGSYYAAYAYKMDMLEPAPRESTKVIKHYIYVLEDWKAYEIDVVTLRQVINGKEYTQKELEYEL